MLKEQILKQYFGYIRFREGQEDLIDHILDGKDCVGIMPTGAGKSLCFQVPALMMNGITLVISPLISLMKDQVQALVASGVPAAFINSMLTYHQTLKALENARYGKYKMIYVAPERLDAVEFIEFAQSADISMVTIDEAHCVSQWGQNFRPSYLKICEFISKLRKRPVISAFTATATKEVKEDIVQLIRLNNPYTLTTGFNRENLYFSVEKPANKYETLKKYLADNPDKSGIIYCSTRKNVEEVCENLIQDQYLATRYHAGLSEQERAINQDDFLYDRKTIMVATNAFGMGIDKSNVSFVIHYNMPKDLESYYQEAGRAGRDGTPAQCILLYNGQDVITNQFLIDNTNEKNDLAPEIMEQVKEKDRERLKIMTWYCHTHDCLREYILRYFGDRTPNYCGNCSNCNTNFQEIDITESTQKILSCIARMGERYGLKMVIDTLRGSKGEKIKRAGLNQLSTYGIMAGEKEKFVRDIINFLVLKGYIMLTNSEYPVAKLTEKARDVLFHHVKLSMKIEKEVKKRIEPKKQSFILNDALYQKLRELRYELAKAKKVPAYVIFADATLIDMCQKRPSTDEEFLAVSGVGKVKLEAYGKEFLSVINDFDQDESAKAVQDTVELNEICQFIKDSIELSDEPIPISMFTDRINALLLQKSNMKIAAQKIADYLVLEGYLKLELFNGKNGKVATDKGHKVGITTIVKENTKGEKYKQNLYAHEAQKHLVEKIQDILENTI